MGKVCTKCGQEKPLTEFPRRGESGRRAHCPNAALNRRTSRYGLTGEAVRELFARFDGQCWICREKPADHLDHDHRCCGPGSSCGACVRGALCQACNRALGHMADRPDLLERAAAYLRESAAERTPNHGR